jgi:hypothetical protein
MAAAVAEARRVLRPDGLLLDIHPIGRPMRLEVWHPLESAGRNGRPSPADESAFERRVLGDFAPDPMVDDFLAATGTLEAAARDGFEAQQRCTFDYLFFFDSLDELTDYLEDNDELDLAGDALLESALQALAGASAPPWLVMAQPVVVNLLRKRGTQ